MTSMRTIVLNGRWLLSLPEHRAARPEWVTGWEPERLAAMCDTITALDTPIVWDIGAEEGDMSALYSLWGADVHAFEPNPLVWPNIRAIWEHNDLRPLAGSFVGFAANRTDLRPPRLDPLIDSDSPDGVWPACAFGPVIGDHGFRTINERQHDTPSIRLDDYLFTVAERRVDVITMDVEGSEWEVLKGAEGVLAECAPVLYISVHPEFMYDQYHQHEGDMHGWLRDRGYVGRHLAFDHEHHWEYRKP